MREASSVRHFQRLQVVADHTLHESNLCRRVGELREIGRPSSVDDTAWLAGSTGLHDRHGRRRRHRSTRSARHERENDRYRAFPIHPFNGFVNSSSTNPVPTENIVTDSKSCGSGSDSIRPATRPATRFPSAAPMNQMPII